MRIEYLADHPQWAPVLAYLHQLTMRLPKERNFDHALNMYIDRCNRDCLPLSLVAIEDTMPVGSVSIHANQLDVVQGYTAWIGGLFVLDAYRSQRFGERLLTEAESVVKSLGRDIVYLFTHTAESFYLQRGWETFATVEPPLVRHTSVVMRKHL